MSGYFRNLARQARRFNSVAGVDRPHPIRDPTDALASDTGAAAPAGKTLPELGCPVVVHRPEGSAAAERAGAGAIVAGRAPERSEQESPRFGSLPASASKAVQSHATIQPADRPIASAAQVSRPPLRSDALDAAVDAVRRAAATSEAPLSAIRQPWPAEHSIGGAEWSGARGESSRGEAIAGPSRSEEPAPEIHVSIGRIEVSTVTVVPPAKPPAAKRSNTMSLAQYEAKRRESRR
jgi:hypothetical protein